MKSRLIKIPEEVIRRLAKLARLQADPFESGKTRSVTQAQKDLGRITSFLSENREALFELGIFTPRFMASLQRAEDDLSSVLDEIKHPTIPHSASLEEPVFTKSFATEVTQLIEMARDALVVKNCQPVAKKIEYHARELTGYLKAIDDTLPFSPNGEIVLLTAQLAFNAKRIRKANAKNKVSWIRQHFVEGLLWTSESAGGGLTLNRRKEGGTLVDALALLQPYLPDELHKGMSFSTLRRIYEEHRRLSKVRLGKISTVAQNNEAKSKKAVF